MHGEFGEQQGFCKGFCDLLWHLASALGAQCGCLAKMCQASSASSHGRQTSQKFPEFRCPHSSHTFSHNRPCAFYSCLHHFMTFNVSRICSLQTWKGVSLTVPANVRPCQLTFISHSSSSLCQWYLQKHHKTSLVPNHCTRRSLHRFDTKIYICEKYQEIVYVYSTLQHGSSKSNLSWQIDLDAGGHWNGCS